MVERDEDLALLPDIFRNASVRDIRGDPLIDRFTRSKSGTSSALTFPRIPSSLSARRSMRVTRGASFRRRRFDFSMRRRSAWYCLGLKLGARSLDVVLDAARLPQAHRDALARARALLAERLAELQHAEAQRTVLLRRSEPFGAAALLGLVERMLSALPRLPELCAKGRELRSRLPAVLPVDFVPELLLVEGGLGSGLDVPFAHRNRRVRGRRGPRRLAHPWKRPSQLAESVERGLQEHVRLGARLLGRRALRGTLTAQGGDPGVPPRGLLVRGLQLTPELPRLAVELLDPLRPKGWTEGLELGDAAADLPAERLAAISRGTHSHPALRLSGAVLWRAHATLHADAQVPIRILGVRAVQFPPELPKLIANLLDPLGSAGELWALASC